MKFHDICGWAGSGAILLAYWLVSNGIVAGPSFENQILNLFGAFTVGYNSYVKKLWAVVALDAVWAVIAINILYHLYK